MRLFAPKPTVDREEFEWLAACFAWLRTVLDDQAVHPALVTALAMFAALHGHDPREAEPALKPYLRGDLRKAAKAVAYHHPDFAGALGAIDLAEWRYD